MRKNSIQSTVFLLFFYLFSLEIKGSESNPLDRLQKEYFSFLLDFFDLSGAIAQTLSELGAEHANYIVIKADEPAIATKLTRAFAGKQRRNLIYLLGSNRDLLNKVRGVNILPSPLIDFIANVIPQVLVNAKKSESVMRDQLVMHIAGGTYDFGPRGKYEVEGFLDVLGSLNLSEWEPVTTFITNFKDTVTHDEYLAGNLGRSLLPFVEHYFQYLDQQSLLKVFSGVVDCFQSFPNESLSSQKILERLTIYIFQSCGPVFVKQMQQLQEEASNESQIGRVLEGLKMAKPMSGARSNQLITDELTKLLQGQGRVEFQKKDKPLGIASIAETYKVKVNGKPYVVKLHRDGVVDHFVREKDVIRRMLSDPSHESLFDKGLKKYYENIIDGINFEIDFSNERKNLEKGSRTYIDKIRGIESVFVPEFANKKSASKNVLFMSLASGHPVGDLMKDSSQETLMGLYKGMLSLYKKYLEQVFDKEATHFIHADLHRENIFSSPKNNFEMTLIDYGSSVELEEATNRNLGRIYRSAKKVKTRRQIEVNILNLAEVLKRFIFESNSALSDTSKRLTSLYFKGCFDPRVVEADVNKVTNEVYSIRGTLKKEVFGVQSDSGRDSIKNDIAFASAILRNCLSDDNNKLVLSLANPKLSVSESMEVVFKELMKNGVDLPKDIVFFNKSKKLLEGILFNITEKLYDQGIEKSDLEDVEVVFDQEIAKLPAKDTGIFGFKF